LISPIRIPQTGPPSTATLVASDPKENDHFGAAVAISGAIAAVGAPDEDTGSGQCTGIGIGDPDLGVVYTFALSGSAWTQNARLALPEPYCGDAPRFGARVALSGSALVVGSFRRQVNANLDLGHAFLYLAAGSPGALAPWYFRAELDPSDSAPMALPGSGVATDGTTVLIGAQHYGTGDGRGRAYTFDNLTTLVDCNNNGIHDSCELLDCNNNGIPDDCDVIGGAQDCNQNLVPDDCERYGPVDIVFLIDSSGSTAPNAERVCQVLSDAAAIIGANARGSCVRFLRIAEPAAGNFPCLFNDANMTDPVPTVGMFLLGNNNPPIPGNPPPCCTILDSDESWAGAVAVAAHHYGWRRAWTRVIVPVSDEGAWAGDDPVCDPFGEDGDAAAHAAAVAIDHDCIVFPFAETSGFISDCAILPMQAIASATGGAVIDSQSALAAQNLAAAILAALPIIGPDCDGDTIPDVCEIADQGNPTHDCNCNGIPDDCEILAGLPDLNTNGVPDECEAITCIEDGDLNEDGEVGFDDLIILLNLWGSGAGPADLNGDGLVGLQDLLIILNNWGWCYCRLGCGVANPKNVAPESISDCLQRFGNNPVALAKCIEAMMLSGTP